MIFVNTWVPASETYVKATLRVYFNAKLPQTSYTHPKLIRLKEDCFFIGNM